MDRDWLARFANEPTLVAPLAQERFAAAMLGLPRHLEAAMGRSEAPADGDDFWTELGPFASKRLRPYSVVNGVLQVPVSGVLLAGFPYALAGYATGYDYIRKAVDRGISDPGVRGIALIVDSPGGMVAGAFDLADHLHAMRGRKPMRAIVAEGAYSAAYALASATDRISVTRTGGVGSIGVVVTHIEVSRALDQAGITVNLIHAGKHKVDGNPFQPLPDDVRARLQGRIDGIHQIFVETVARNRGMSPDVVRKTEAATFAAAEAVANGLADEIASLDAALASFAGGRPGAPILAARSASATVPPANPLSPSSREATLASVTEPVRLAGLDRLMENVAGNDARQQAAGIIAAAKASGASIGATALQLLEAGLCARTDEEIKAAYASSPALRREFPTEAAYAAYRRADMRGAVRPSRPAAATPVVHHADESSARAAYQGSPQLRAEYPTEAAYLATWRHENRLRTH